MLSERGLARNIDYQLAGYSYYLRGDVDTVHVGNAFIVGDTAGFPRDSSSDQARAPPRASAGRSRIRCVADDELVIVFVRMLVHMMVEREPPVQQLLPAER